MLRNCCYFIDYGKSTSRFGTLKKIASLEKHCEELRFFKRAGIRVLCSVRCQIKIACKPKLSDRFALEQDPCRHDTRRNAHIAAVRTRRNAHITAVRALQRANTDKNSDRPRHERKRGQSLMAVI
jgi:hypothetical protein